MAYLPVLLLPGFCCFFPPFIPSLTQSCEKGWKTPLCLGEKGDFARQKYHNSLEPWMEMYIFSLSFIDVHISIHVYTYIYIQPFSYIYIYVHIYVCYMMYISFSFSIQTDADSNDSKAPLLYTILHGNRDTYTEDH